MFFLSLFLIYTLLLCNNLCCCINEVFDTVIFISFPYSVSYIALFAVCIIAFILDIFCSFCNLGLLSISILSPDNMYFNFFLLICESDSFVDEFPFLVLL